MLLAALAVVPCAKLQVIVRKLKAGPNFQRDSVEVEG
jgi:hypothetical protein